MEKIKATDVWLDTGVTNPEPIFAGGMQIHTTLEKKTAMIVLTEMQFDNMMNSFSEVIRSLSRINNKHPLAVLQLDLDRLETAKKIFSEYSSGDSSQQLKQSTE